jgi:Tfp pilus assembly protein PilZ
MEQAITSSPDESVRQASRAVVDYYAITPKGSQTRFSGVGVALNQMSGNPQSETAVLGYLQKKHAPCTIQINSIRFE